MRFSLSVEGPDTLLAVTGADLLLALLQASGSPFSSTRSVGQCLQDPMMMLGLDMSGMASNLSSSMAKRNRRKRGRAQMLAGSMKIPQGYMHQIPL